MRIWGEREREREQFQAADFTDKETAQTQRSAVIGEWVVVLVVTVVSEAWKSPQTAAS